jgi:hypothetical protein
MFKKSKMNMQQRRTAFDRFLLREIMPSLYHSPFRPLTPLVTGMWHVHPKPTFSQVTPLEVARSASPARIPAQQAA